MQILSIDCHYPGPYDSWPDDTGESLAAQKRNMNAERLLEAAMVKLGLKCYHQYSWPDGSLYKYGISRNREILVPHDIERELNKTLGRFGIHVSVNETDPDYVSPGYTQTLGDWLRQLGEEGL